MPDAAKVEADKAKADAEAAKAADEAKATAAAEERKNILESDLFVPADLQEKADHIARDLRLQRALASKQLMDRAEASDQNILVGKTEAERVWDKAMTIAIDKVKDEDPTETDQRFATSESLVAAHEENAKFDAAAEKAAPKAKTTKADDKK